MIASHFRLLVGDFPATFRFYREIVGLPTTYSPESGGPYAEFELGGDKYLGLFDRALMLEAVGRPAELERTQDVHAMLCISVPDVNAEARRLEALGVELAAPPADHESWGMRTVYVRDPEGNLVEFYGPLGAAGATPAEASD
jgi:catechol 2,3-dioxygenase-like lactoylglutathione lyase family enzyme